jgi:hypothetical protein
MLNHHGLIKSLLFTFLIVTVIGCGKKTAKPINPESLPPAFSQVLIVKNETPDEIQIFPAPGLIGEPLAIKPGESIAMNFMVSRKASLDKSGNPSDHGWTVEIDKQNRFLGMKGGDGLLRIKTSKGQLWEYRIDLGKCWFENKRPPKEHELIIHEKGPGQRTPAVELCE